MLLAERPPQPKVTGKKSSMAKNFQDVFLLNWLRQISNKGPAQFMTGQSQDVVEQNLMVHMVWGEAGTNNSWNFH